MFLPILVLGISDPSDPAEVDKLFAAEPASAPAARSFVLSAVTPDHVDAEMRLATLVSELATNAILHARTPFRVKVDQDRSRIRVSVSDRSTAWPTKKSYGSKSSTGRGLRIIESFADRWGVSPNEEGKTVWFEIDRVAVS